MESVEYEHQPALLAEAIESLQIDPCGFYVDATYGRGGHSREILRRLNTEGRLFAFDKDPEACRHAQQEFMSDTRL